MTTPLMTIGEFATALRITKACVRRWILERRITSIKVGRLVKLPQSEVERLIEAGLRPACSAKPPRKEVR